MNKSWTPDYGTCSAWSGLERSAYCWDPLISHAVSIRHPNARQTCWVLYSSTSVNIWLWTCTARSWCGQFDSTPIHSHPGTVYWHASLAKLVLLDCYDEQRDLRSGCTWVVNCIDETDCSINYRKWISTIDCCHGDILSYPRTNWEVPFVALIIAVWKLDDNITCLNWVHEMELVAITGPFSDWDCKIEKMDYIKLFQARIQWPDFWRWNRSFIMYKRLEIYLSDKGPCSSQ